MARDFSKKFYQSKAWKRCRDAYYISKYGLCEKCGEPGIIVHHKIVLSPLNINDPNITLNWEHLELLCLECHNSEHGGSVTAEGLKFDVEGNLVRIGG